MLHFPADLRLPCLKHYKKMVKKKKKTTFLAFKKRVNVSLEGCNSGSTHTHKHTHAQTHTAQCAFISMQGNVHNVHIPTPLQKSRQSGGDQLFFLWWKVSAEAP